jgi:hypothetical protein
MMKNQLKSRLALSLFKNNEQLIIQRQGQHYHEE